MATLDSVSVKDYMNTQIVTLTPDTDVMAAINIFIRRGLGDGLGTMQSQLLPDFGGEAADGGVIKIQRQRRLFVAPRALDLVLLALDVARVLRLNLDLLGDQRIVGARADAGELHQRRVS